MNKIFFFFPQLLFFFSFVFGQNTFSEGKLILQNGDTLFGQILQENWINNPDKIIFKQEGKSITETYSPNQIKAFYVADLHFISATIQMEVSPIQTLQLSEDAEFEFKSQIAFLQAIITGPKSLFLLIDKQGKEHFYVQLQNEIVLLKYKKYLKSNYDKNAIAERKTYLRQLNDYLSGCETLRDEIAASMYAQKSLEKLFLTFYSCINLQPIVRAKLDKFFEGLLMHQTIAYGLLTSFLI